MFVDCNFSCVPKRFIHLLIIMIYTAATGNYELDVCAFFYFLKEIPLVSRLPL